MTFLLFTIGGFVLGSVVGGGFVKSHHLLTSKEREARCTYHDVAYGPCKSGKSGACVDDLCGEHCKSVHKGVCLTKFLGD